MLAWSRAVSARLTRQLGRPGLGTSVRVDSLPDGPGMLRYRSEASRADTRPERTRHRQKIRSSKMKSNHIKFMRWLRTALT